MTLAELILGPPLLLDDRAAAAANRTVVDTLNSHLEGLAAFIRRHYPLDEQDMALVLDDIRRVRALPGETAPEITAKRALVLFSLYGEEEATLHWTERDLVGDDPTGVFAYDVDTRVLPVLVPEFMRTMCQRPDVFVRMAAVLHAMWPGEDLSAIYDGEIDSGPSHPPLAAPSTSPSRSDSPNPSISPTLPPAHSPTLPPAPRR